MPDVFGSLCVAAELPVASTHRSLLVDTPAPHHSRLARDHVLGCHLYRPTLSRTGRINFGIWCVGLGAVKQTR
jgi:hypothetical protein